MNILKKLFHKLFTNCEKETESELKYKDSDEARLDSFPKEFKDFVYTCIAFNISDSYKTRSFYYQMVDFYLNAELYKYIDFPSYLLFRYEKGRSESYKDTIKNEKNLVKEMLKKTK